MTAASIRQRVDRLEAVAGPVVDTATARRIIFIEGGAYGLPPAEVDRFLSEQGVAVADGDVVYRQSDSPGQLQATEMTVGVYPWSWSQDFIARCLVEHFTDSSTASDWAHLTRSEAA